LPGSPLLTRGGEGEKCEVTHRHQVAERGFAQLEVAGSRRISDSRKKRGQRWRKRRVGRIADISASASGCAKHRDSRLDVAWHSPIDFL